MFDQMHPSLPGETRAATDARNEKFTRSNPLRIASEYEAAFGREKLDLFLRERNPDADFHPGDLHRSLLELPWADVFTTNYDTLLERTEISSRSYQPINKVAELPTSFSPRIVKLHGSFPSHTPFIISEEDYRTYPHRFAPFVNTVQQALLENSFVLVGFSGDDPNFLEWTGWIRDELGTSHAPIYLVGPLFLENADRLLLHRRGVTPIDLAPCFLHVHEDQIHEASINWFLRCLAAAKPPRQDRWPEFDERPISVPAELPPIIGASERVPESVAAEKPSRTNSQSEFGETVARGPIGLLPVLVPPEVIPEDVGRFPHPQKALSNEVVSKLFKRWEFERRHYPGWIILPDNKRSSLWSGTKYWLGPLFDFTKDWPIAERILLFHEINWRLEMAMVPLFPAMIEPFEKAINDAFAVFLSGNTLNVSGAILLELSTSSNEILSAWLEIAFGLLCEARETYNETRWKVFAGKIEKMVPQMPRFEDRCHYEKALWAVWNIRRSDAVSELAKWQPSSRSPLACMRKAGLLAELDEVGEARTILRSALLDVRRSLRTHGRSIELLSLEGWITYLIFAVEQATNFARRSIVREEFLDRWQELKAWGCSPWDQKDYFEQELLRQPPKLDRGDVEVVGFDPGHVSISKHFGDNIDDFLPAFGCIRLYEQVGLPMRIPCMNLTGESLKNACNWIAPFIGFWSPALLVRAGNVDNLTKDSPFLTRPRVAVMQLESVKRLHEWSLNILERELTFTSASVNQHSSQEALLRVLPEVISRLAFRVSESELRRSFLAALRFHKAPAVRSNHLLQDVCDPWFERTFEAANGPLLLEWLPEILKAPLFDEGDSSPGILDDFRWPDPMNHFPILRAAKSQGQQELILKIRDAISWLLNKSVGEVGIGWRRAMFRLLMVFEAKFMTEAQAQRFGELIWSKRGVGQLPDLPNVVGTRYALVIPVPTGTNAQDLVKRYVLSMSPMYAVNQTPSGQRSIASFGWKQMLVREAILVSKPLISFQGEPLVGIEWTPEEAHQLYEKVQQWWAQDKVAVQTEQQRRGDSLIGGNVVFNEGKLLGQFFYQAVLPWVNWRTEKDWVDFMGWIEELRTIGLYPTVVLPYVLQHRPDKVAAFNAVIQEDLNSDVEEAITGAAEAVRHWAHLAKQRLISEVQPNLLSILVRRVVFRREPRVAFCLSSLSHLIFEAPELFTSEQIGLVIASLQPWSGAVTLPVPDNAAEGFPELKRPHLRRLVGELAGALKLWRTKANETAVSPPIMMWEAICASDPLPEVRRAFDSWDLIHASSN
jgi:hypothetical protein